MDQQSADKRAKVSLILGLLSIIATCLTGLPAIIFGALALKGSSSGGKKMAIAGIALGLFSWVWPVWFTSAVGGATKRQQAELEEGKKRLEAKRAACREPNRFRVMPSSPYSQAPEFQTDADWECITPEQAAREEAAAKEKARQEAERERIDAWERQRYETIDAIKIAGPAAQGHLGHMRFRRGRTESTYFVAYPCEGAAGIVWAELAFTREQAPAVLGLSEKYCTYVDFVIGPTSSLGTVTGSLYRIP